MSHPAARRIPGIALLSVAILASAPLFAATPINQSRPLDPRGRVEIENIKGRIDVRAWDRPEVKIEGSLGAGVEKLEIEGDRERLVVKVKYPNRGGGLGFLTGGDKSEPTLLRLMVPLQADLEIDAVSADVDVSGIASGELSIDSVSGDVTVAGAPREASIDSVSGDLHLTLNRANVSVDSVSGDIVLRGRLGEEVGIETVSGDIDVSVLETAVRKLSGATVSGDMHIGTALATSGQVNLESVSGDVLLELPRALSANVRADSFSGDLSAPGANIIRPKHGPGTSFEHRYGNGSGDISIETFSGNARLRLDN
ncbi:DUF4097 domain-containing protein [Lysobacter koreensis]|uniref:DUF4097 domain-containing protein n=1 Tax=Lysobacter koreensis TaxID=266122 RepID=A0ABW2YLR0_9GAMM